MIIKYYIATKEDKVGTVFSIVEFVDNELTDIYTSKINSNGLESFEDITKFIVKRDSTKYNYQHLLSFKFKKVDVATHIGNFLDKDDSLKEIKKKDNTYFSSPAVFTGDDTNMHRATLSLDTYLTMREHYIKEGKIK